MATLQVNITNLATRMATECKSLRTLMNGNATDLSALNTTAKANLVNAVNELEAEINALQGSLVVINDAGSGSSDVWSATKVAAEILAAKNALINGAATALDTLSELATALGNDANFASTVTTALANRVRYDAAQTLTAGQITQACANIGIGEPDTNFVTTFNAGLV